VVGSVPLRSLSEQPVSDGDWLFDSREEGTLALFRLELAQREAVRSNSSELSAILKGIVVGDYP